MLVAVSCIGLVASSLAEVVCLDDLLDAAEVKFYSKLDIPFNYSSEPDAPAPGGRRNGCRSGVTMGARASWPGGWRPALASS